MQIDRTIPPAPDAVNVQERLLYEMRSGCFKDCDRLPRESLLAEALSISRTQLRDSLAELERELGCELLVREARGVTLTDEGVLLRKRADEIKVLQSNIVMIFDECHRSQFG